MAELKGPDYRLLPSRKNPRVRRWFRVADRMGGGKVRDALPGDHPLAVRAGRDSPLADALKLMLDAKIVPAEVDRVGFEPDRTGWGMELKVPVDYESRVDEGSFGRRVSVREVFTRDLTRAMARELFDWPSVKGGMDYQEWVGVLKKALPDLDLSDFPRRFAEGLKEEPDSTLVEYVIHEPEVVRKFLDRYASLAVGEMGMDYSEPWVGSAVDGITSLALGCPAVAARVYRAASCKGRVRVTPKPPSDPATWPGGNEEWIVRSLDPVEHEVAPAAFSFSTRERAIKEMLNDLERVPLHETPYVKHPRVRRYLAAFARAHPRVFSRAARAGVVFLDAGDPRFRYLPGTYLAMTSAEVPFYRGKVSAPLSLTDHMEDGGAVILMHAGDADKFSREEVVSYPRELAPYAIFTHEFTHVLDQEKLDEGKGEGFSGSIIAKDQEAISEALAKHRDGRIGARVEYALENPQELPAILAEMAIVDPEAARELLGEPAIKRFADRFFGFDLLKEVLGDRG